MTVTRWQIKTKIWQEMEQNSDSITYSSQRLNDIIDEVSQEIIEWKVANELTWKFIQGNILNFNQWKFAIKIIADLQLTWDITPASTEIPVDGTNLPINWAILIWNDVIEYTWNSWVELLLATWILSDHKEWDTVNIIYSVPTDFWKSTKVYSFIQRQENEILYKDSNNQLVKYYETLDWENWKYIYFYWVTWDDLYYVNYTKQYTPMTDDISNSIFSDYISLNVIPFICGGRIIKDELLRVKLLTQWYNKIATEFIKEWEKVWKPKNIQRKRFGFNSIR